MKVRFEPGKSSSNDWICLLLLRNPRSEVKASWEQKIADFLLCSGDTFGGGEARLKVKNKKTWTRKMKEFFDTGSTFVEGFSSRVTDSKSGGSSHLK